MPLEVAKEATESDAKHALTDGIHHIAVQTTQLDNSIRWYQDFFGCEVSWTLEKFSPLTLSRLPGISRLAELATGGIRFHVFSLGPDHQRPARPEANQFQHVCLPVQSPASLVHWRDKWLRLFSSGQYAFARPEPATEIVTDADGMQSFYTYDVNGLEYEFSFIPDGLMATPAEELVITLPEDDSWQFGGLPYGLEPLILPTQWIAPDGHGSTLPGDPGSRRLGEHPRADVLAALEPSNAATVDRLFWFRWIAGHQTTFLLWQLLAAAMAEAANDPGSGDALRRARLYVRGYSQMLLYTSSCTREIYNRVIRSVIARQHPHLSGSWARDYGPVRALLRGRVELDGPDGAALAEECLLNEHIHNGIAAKLVPSGPSLLQTAKNNQNGLSGRRGMLLTLYDSIFLTVRAPTSYEMVIVQLVRRLQAINLDIAANSLYPLYASSAGEEPAGLREAPTMRCKDDFSRILTEIGKAAVASCTPGPGAALRVHS